MKKTKVIAFSLVASIMLVGAGFAAWTDNLHFSTTAKTGTLNVQFTGAPSTVNGWLNNSPYVKFENPSITNDKKGVAFTLSNLYPGAQYHTKAAAQSVGSIPAKLGSLDIGFDFDGTLSDQDKNDLKKNVKVSLVLSKINKNGTKSFPIPTPSYSLSDIESNKNAINNFLSSPLNAISYDQGEQFSIDDLKVNIDDAAGNNTQGKSVTFTVNSTWKQFNK
jgi:hypothetical protein